MTRHKEKYQQEKVETNRNVEPGHLFGKIPEARGRRKGENLQEKACGRAVGLFTFVYIYVRKYM